MHKTKLNLRAALSPDHLAEPDDIFNTKKTLMALGYYRPPLGPKPAPGSTAICFPVSGSSSATTTSRSMR